MAKKPETDEDGDKIYLCEWCGAEFLSRQGRWAHEKKCEHRPTEDGPGDDDGPGPAGITIFGDDDGPGDDDDGPAGAAAAVSGDTYQCPSCGHVEGMPFEVCPSCGTGLVWD